ncbi:hypothetical protein ACH4XT_41125 [Streptomyces avidinii]|uniref:hypothetical protein n=1 Tax=Streptomyces avidinii TaxID=1895 RepID=UPI00379AC68B
MTWAVTSVAAAGGTLSPRVPGLAGGPAENDSGTRSRMAVTITAAPAMGRAERQSLLREALVHMAREFGYVDAEVDLL